MRNAHLYRPGGVTLRAICRLLVLLLLAVAWGNSSAASGQASGERTAAETLHLPAAEPAEASSSLIVHAALDMPQARPLLKAFHRRYPQIEVRYRNMTTLGLYERFLEDPGGADVVISSAMPWQFSLANDGYAQSPEAGLLAHWPDWAHWRRELVAFTFEPIVMVYHPKLMELADPPANHAQLLALLHKQKSALQGRVATYDPAKSGAGYGYAVEESRLSPRYWELVAGLGSVNAELNTTTAQTLRGLAEGRYWLGYNLLGSYARAFVDEHSELELVIPDDYALVVQRLAFMAKQAPHPEAARLFMGFLVSKEGQQVIATETTLGAIHPEVRGSGSAAKLRTEMGAAVRPVELNPQLLAALDRLKRRALLTRWRREFHRESEAEAAE
ncbi:ABC transporter substrate-binding protein [Halomonas garicola]|uniref:ABC transporter substrate-binding protein n=1 Tax=Halomonas garicola TaxID=1690008 RepID=UPI00289C1252|nr:ABC transporter substrate-binding protein [Halomonas garicola]